MKKLSFIAIWFLTILSLQAQKGVTASGGDATNTTGSISYSIGQVDFASAANATGAINAGIQQPYEIFVSAVEAQYANIRIDVFPNPADHYLNLSIDAQKANSFSYQLIDMNGRLLKEVAIVNEMSVIHTAELAPAVYFLNITEQGKPVKSFKIVKK